MKYIGRFTSRLAVCGLALAALTTFVNTLEAQTAKQGTAEVRKILGTQAKYSTSGNNVWIPLKVGNVLNAGSVVQTGPGTTVDLFLGRNGPTVRLTEGTTLSIDKLTHTSVSGEDVIDTQLDLKEGRILGSVRRLAAASRYEVKTPTGVAGIRGTDYDISGSGVITCVQGNILFAYVNPNGEITTHNLMDAQTFVPGRGVTPTPPELLRALNEAVANLNLIVQPTDTPTAQPTYDPAVDPFVSPVTGANVD
ncbi:MAG TPA: FecR domain-containing protein [Methylomirabilota bacterium]|nr:FecR domain-containing protein [Methylomirabilota bacterium]